jgi:pyruvate/2-oxoglutarate dehydrogenase complex dihydrolipoamide dehydrogenase (E3) component
LREQRKEGSRVAVKFDLVVIDGGNAGYVPAIRANQQERRNEWTKKRQGG